ncbi:MAG: hypothetical protein QGG42_05635 [Phycisphaerae bacterium]|jgi:hypothetical protein|nr:hypothetical protein [Phycisphaerae bacterium]
MPDIPFWIRIAALVGLMSIVAGVDAWYRRARSTRWKEYLFILVTGCAGAVFGSLTDMVTSSISPDYFVYGKELPAEGLRWSAMLLGLQAGFSAGAIAGALCLFVGVRNLAKTSISLPRAAMLSWRPFLLAVIFAAVIPLAGARFDPMGFLEELRILFGPERAGRFLTVWQIHLGVYLGLGVGVVWMIVTIRRLSGVEATLSS